MIRHLTDLFFPRVCSGCKSLLLGNEYVICTSCRHEIPLTGFHLDPNNEAVSKFYGLTDLQFASSFLYFHKRGIVQELIHSLKYRGHEEIGKLLGHWYGEELKTVPAIQDLNYIIPVPLHKHKLRKRGYNQVASFGKALSSELGVPYADDILYKTRNVTTQSKKTLLQRAQLSSNAFAVNFDQSHHHAHFLLIDDVLTTGTTLTACAKALAEIPGARKSIVTMAITH
jgi:ComF family protein